LVLALNRPVTNDQLKISQIQDKDAPSILYQRVGKLFFDKTKYPSNFIEQLFRHYVKKFVIRESVGSDQPFISLTALYKHKVPLPYSGIEQQKIADFLSTVDKKISLLKEKHGLLQQYKKGVAQKLFKQEIRMKDENGNAFTDWRIKKGNEIFDVISNKKHDSDLPILAITQEHGAIPRDLINYQVQVTDTSVSGYKVVDKGDYIISLRSFQGGIEYSKYKGICSPAYIILRPSVKINDDFFRYYLKTSDFIQEMKKRLEGIRDGKILSYKYFSEINLPYPSIDEQNKIAAFLNAIDKKIGIVNQQIELTQTFKKGLLQQLFV
jgi:type I restriction enzyme S subunit